MLDNNGESALNWASRWGELKTIKLLVEYGANVSHADRFGRSTLVKVLNDIPKRKVGLAKVVQLLLEKGADANGRDPENRKTSLMMAVEGLEHRERKMILYNPEEFEVAELLLKRGADINARDPISNKTAVIIAAENGSLKSFIFLVEHNASLEGCTNELCRQQAENSSYIRKLKLFQVGPLGKALIDAASRGETASVDYLLKQGALIDFLTGGEPTALIAAAMKGHTDTVRLLLDRGANIHRKDFENRTALLQAAKSGQFETVELLIERGADVHYIPNQQTVLMALAQPDAEPDGTTRDYSKISKCVRMLKERGVDLDAGGDSVLLLAASGRLRTMEPFLALVENGASTKRCQGSSLSYCKALEPDWDPNLLSDEEKDYFFNFVGHAESNSFRSVAFLLDRGNFSSYYVRKVGETSALLEAIGGQHVEMVRLLLERGADVNAKATVEESGEDDEGEVRGVIDQVALAGSFNFKTDIPRLLFEYGANDEEGCLDDTQCAAVAHELNSRPAKLVINGAICGA